MGKFGNRNLPRFMEDNIENPEELEENHENQLSPIEILSLGDHGDDHAMILIKTKDGEEVELKFDYDGNGMLIAQHGDHEYSIPVEIEVISDDESYGPISTEIEDYEETGRVYETFKQFMEGCCGDKNEGYNPAMSEEAKRAVKAVCEQYLINEAQRCDEDQDPSHTYENYLAECGSFMVECMMEAATNVEVEEN